MKRIILGIAIGLLAASAGSVGQSSDDGRPPQLTIQQYKTETQDNYPIGGMEPPRPHYEQVQVPIGPAPHWVCEKGYEPDGLDVTWPDGVFTPKPARCKASEIKEVK